MPSKSFIAPTAVFWVHFSDVSLRTVGSCEENLLPTVQQDKSQALGLQAMDEVVQALATTDTRMVSSTSTTCSVLRP